MLKDIEKLAKEESQVLDGGLGWVIVGGKYIDKIDKNK